jgi:hypothetical protein
MECHAIFYIISQYFLQINATRKSSDGNGHGNVIKQGVKAIKDKDTHINAKKDKMFGYFTKLKRLFQLRNVT